MIKLDFFVCLHTGQTYISETLSCCTVCKENEIFRYIQIKNLYRRARALVINSNY